MSMYNMLFGVNPATFMFLPMLGKHPDWYPRFRDCFVGDNDKPEHAERIIVYTRTGGGNRETHENRQGYIDWYNEEPPEGQVFNEDIRQLPGFVEDYDDDFDNTYANFVFDPPEQWEKDFKLLKEGKLAEVSDEYVEQACSVFPKIDEKIRQIFRPEKEVEGSAA